MRTLISRVLAAALMASGSWTLAAPAWAQSTPQAALPGPVAGLIVQLKNAPSHERMSALSATSQRATEAGRLQQVLQAARMTEVRMKPVGKSAQHFDFGRVLSATEAETLAAELRKQPEVEWVELNSREHLLQATSNVPNDTYYSHAAPSGSTQWWMYPYNIGATSTLPDGSGLPGVQTAWLTEKGKSAAIVAVLDTGITSHSELTGRTVPGYDFVSEVVYANDGGGRDNDPSDPGDWVEQSDFSNTLFEGCDVVDSSWHGTIVAGIIAASTNNNSGIAGVNWNGRILPVRVAGKCGATVSDLVDAMRWAAGLTVQGVPTNPNPARIINISFGGSAACGDAYQSAIDELATVGTVVVAAAGNGQSSVSRPANCRGVVGVGALARDGLKATYSNYGSQVVVSTVGGDPEYGGALLTLRNSGLKAPVGGSYADAYGTSFSTPVVAGVVSLMRSANPNLTVAQVISGLQASARPHVQSNGVGSCSAFTSQRCVCTTATCGAGIVDADQAVKWAINAPLGTTPTNPPATSNGDSGGGALSGLWLAGLALAVAGAQALRRSRGARSR